MTDTIGKIYSDFMKEKFIKDKLKKGEIPSVEEVDEAVVELQNEFNNFNSPLTREEIYTIELDSTSSAAKMNEIFELLESDLSICIKSLLTQGNRMSDLYDATFSKLEGFDRKIEKLQSRIDRLLFDSKNSDRHEGVFYERFESDQMIDLVNSTVELDELSNSVNIAASASNVVPLSGNADDIEVRVESNPAIINSADVNGLEVANLVNITNNVWQRQVNTTEPVSQLYCEVILTLPSSNDDINKIIVEPAGGDIKTQVNMEVSYSNDKLNWQFPDGERRKRLVKRTTFDFSNQTAKYWKLKLTKLGNDGFFGSNYVYNFGLRNVLFLGKQYEKVNRLDVSKLYSKIIKPEKPENISAVNMQVCEIVPANTNIVYEVAPLIQTQIDDLEAQTITPDDVRYYLADLEDVDSYTLDMLKLVSEPTINNIMGSNTIEYKDQDLDDFALDYVVGASLSKNDTVLLRNAGDNSDYDVVGQQKRIRGNALGWVSTDLYYSTFVLIEERDGVILDIGDTKMVVNGNEVSGKVRIPAGLNHVASPKQHWQSIDITSLPATSDAQPDPLYPFNHKYLIEGIGNTLYGQDLTQQVGGVDVIDIIDPNQVYRSTRQNWEIRMSEISFDRLDSKDNSALDVFSYKVDNNNQERIVVKSTEENGLLNRESFSIITKIQNSDPVKGLIFKATLTSDDLKTTPVLTEYLLKFR